MSGDEDAAELNPTDGGGTPGPATPDSALPDSSGPDPVEPGPVAGNGPEPAPAGPPEPGGATSLDELAAVVRALWEWAGRPSEEALRASAGGGGAEDLPPGTVAAVLGGHIGTWESIEPFVAACLRHGQRSVEQVSLGLMAWRDAWNAFDPTVRHLPVQRPADGSVGVGTQTPAWPQNAVPPLEPVPPLAPVPPVDVPVAPAGQPRRRISVVAAAAGVVAVLVAVGGTVALASTSPLHGTPHPQAGPTTGSPDTAVAPPGLSAPLPSVSGSTPAPSPTGSSASPTPAHTGGPRPTDAGTHPASQPPTTAPAPPPPPPASTPTSSSPAPPSYPTVYTTSGQAGKAYFVALGEHLFVCDLTPDGYGVVAQYTRTDVPGQNNEAKDGNGSGTCIDHNMNMPEGAKITFRVCLISKSGALSRCSGRITAVA